MSSSRNLLANAIRVLSMEAVQAANSGHPGAPMGLADVAEVLWRDFLSHNPADSTWMNRDRFVLSNGHGSMLLYSLLHLTGYDVSLQDLQDFRQLHSKTAGHPEYGECPGVETTTGPLGQGIATAVGMALAEKKLAAEFNTSEFDLVDHRTWVIVGDGCLMEGISHEAASLAGTLALDKLICIYDDNGISIDGEVDAWFNEDVPARFEAYGWRVIRNVDGHDAEEITKALSNAAKSDGRPTLVCCKTTIGFGSPSKQGTASAHGSVLGREEIELTKAALGWAHEGWDIPEDVYQAWNQREAGALRQHAWQQVLDGYSTAHPQQAAEFVRRMRGELPANWQESIQAFAEKEQQSPANLETRKSSQACISAIAAGVPELFGGSADLTGSNNTRWAEATDDQHMSYGVREFGMTAISNGIQLHGGYRPFTGTFLIFMEYARNAVRLAALMKVPNIFVYTHDSVAVGEDGPTHQPVEQITNLRTTPNLHTWRPCDTVESAIAWQSAVASTDSPSALIFTRQKTVAQARDKATFDNIQWGGYVLRDTDGQPDAIVIATGSEVELAVAAAESLASSNVKVRVVSMPCVEVFAAQSAQYKESVLPNAVRARVAVEAGHPDFWHRFVGLDGIVVGISSFGMSAPGPQAMAELGITTENVVQQIRNVIGATG
jgi:transketolase|tara:strand:- start:7762 stop:9750 length:1989 start_codon:yes stop_codon:yes gene_type:complete